MELYRFISKFLKSCSEKRQKELISCRVRQNFIQKQSLEFLNKKKVFLKIYKKTSVLESLFINIAGLSLQRFLKLPNSHKKRKDSLEGSLDRVLLAAELEFPKILVPRLPQHISNVNIECAGKSEWLKQQCSLNVTSFLEH